MLFATVRQRKIYVKNPVTVIQKGKNVDVLRLDMDGEWQEMESIVCVFTLRYKAEGETQEVVRQVLHTYGETVQVPWECVAEAGLLSVSCTGYVGGEKVMTTMLPDSFWTVAPNGPMEGDPVMEATQSLYDQIVAAAGRAVSAAEAAEAAREQLEADRENGVFDGVVPTVEVGSVTEGAEAKVVNSGTEQAVRLDFVLPRGPQGLRGPAGQSGRGVQTMTYGDGRWTVTYTDGTTEVVELSMEGGTAGSDGGYYVPHVDEDGVLTWTASKAGMEAVAAAQVRGRGVSAVTYDRTAQVWRFTFTDGTSRSVGGPAIPAALRELEEDSDHRTVTDAEKAVWDGKSAFSGSYGDLTGVPSTFQPSTHNQGAGTITTGTFAGQVKAYASGQTVSTYLLRNSRLASSAVNPTVNGEICWVYQ